MAYATSNPPVRVWGTMAGASGWYYTSDDVATDVDLVGYFTDGHDLGMRVGDVVFIIEADNTYLLTMSSVTVSTAGGASTIVTI